MCFSHFSLKGKFFLTVLRSAIFNSSDDSNLITAQPVLQCVQVKPLTGQQGAPERFRVVFSDISNFVQSMLATRERCGFDSPPSQRLTNDP